MRLINTTTRELEDFIDGSIPPYAILSHTWEGEGGKEEVTFQEYERLMDPTQQTHPSLTRVRDKSGLAKINRCLELAASRGIEYAWVDTCCIDKKSSAELSEAINSMFKWYKKSEICFAYLCDVDVDVGTLSSLRFGDSLETISKFTGARWFTRGWTLQELVAPAEVEFYDWEWSSLGRRRHLSFVLSRITGISEVIFRSRDNNLLTYPIATRMSWASKRQTTRVEDMAYCLMGIFDVNMPLLYGEGERAFLRLQQQIATQNGDQSLFWWDPPMDEGSWESPLQVQEASMRIHRGLLARSPSEFRSDFPGVPDTLYAETILTTNQGSHTKLALFDPENTRHLLPPELGTMAFSSNESIAFLGSPLFVRRRGLRLRAAIVLAKCGDRRDGRPEYARVGRGLLLHATKTDNTAPTKTDVWIPQQPRLFLLPGSLRVSGVRFIFHYEAADHTVCATPSSTDSPGSRNDGKEVWVAVALPSLRNVEQNNIATINLNAKGKRGDCFSTIEIVRGNSDAGVDWADSSLPEAIKRECIGIAFPRLLGSARFHCHFGTWQHFRQTNSWLGWYAKASLELRHDKLVLEVNVDREIFLSARLRGPGLDAQ